MHALYVADLFFPFFLRESTSAIGSSATGAGTTEAAGEGGAGGGARVEEREGEEVGVVRRARVSTPDAKGAGAVREVRRVEAAGAAEAAASRGARADAGNRNDADALALCFGA